MTGEVASAGDVGSDAASSFKAPYSSSTGGHIVMTAHISSTDAGTPRHPECPDCEPPERPDKRFPEQPAPTPDNQPMRSPSEAPVIPDSHPETSPPECPD